MESCVSSRCLSCFDRRSMTHQDGIGNDGRPYKSSHARPTSTVDPTKPLQQHGSARLPIVADGTTRGAHAPHTRVNLMGGAGATLHNIRLQHAVRAEAPGALRVSVRRTTSAAPLTAVLS